MKKYNALASIFLGLLITNCGGTEDLFNINEEKLKGQYTLPDQLSVEILNQKT
jgi:hypothetical protein